MKLSLKTRHKVSQVFIPGRGWQQLGRFIPMRRLLWKRHSHIMQGATAVHFVDHGDYTIAELQRNRSNRHGIQTPSPVVRN